MLAVFMLESHANLSAIPHQCMLFLLSVLSLLSLLSLSIVLCSLPSSAGVSCAVLDLDLDLGYVLKLPGNYSLQLL